MFGTTHMQLQLRSSAGKWALEASILLLLTAYVAVGAARYLAFHEAASGDPNHLLLAARLDPSNAEYRNLLGRSELLGGHPQQAVSWLQPATALNPHAAKYWVDLAIARQQMDDPGGENQALQRALLAAPTNADVAWEAANLYLANGSTEDAMKQFHTVMESAPPLIFHAITTCWKVRPNIDYLLSEVVPANAYPQFLEFLISQKQPEAASKTWDRLTALNQPLSSRYLFEYFQYLVLNHDPDRAGSVWREGVILAGLQAYQPSAGNMLINGDFGLSLLNAGFDWVHTGIPGVGLALDPGETHSGGRSLRITLDGPGISDAGIRQIVAVEPGRAYRFSAFYKAKAMDGAGGMKFSIQDFYTNSPLLLSEDLEEADFWKSIGGEFRTGPDTHLVLLRVARVPSGSPIRGQLWIDGLQLAPAEESLNQERTP